MLLEVQNVTKRFEKGGKTITALKQVSFSADRPQVIGLVGLNGAGKTTLINVIAGILIPDEGMARINREETWRKPGKLIAYPYVPRIDQRMTVADIVDVLQLFYGKGAWEKYVNILGLEKEWSTEYQRLSTGWKQRINIPSAVGQKKPVVLLDEITNGLDAITADAVLDVMAEKGRESVVVFASHIFDHVERVADRILIINGGKILKDLSWAPEMRGTIEQLFRSVITRAQ